MLRVEARAYLRNIGVQFSQKRGENPEGAKDYLRHETWSFSRNIALFEALCLPDNSTYGSIFAIRDQLDTACDNARNKTVDKVKKMDLAQRKNWNAISDRIEKYSPFHVLFPHSSEINSPKDVELHVMSQEYKYIKVLETARDVLSYEAFQDKERFIARFQLGADAKQYAVLEKFLWYFPESYSLDEVSLGNFFKQNFKMQKGTLHPDLSKYVTFFTRLNRFKKIDPTGLMDLEGVAKYDYLFDEEGSGIPDEITLSDGTVVKLPKEAMDPWSQVKDDYGATVRRNTDDLEKILTLFNPELSAQGLKVARGVLRFRPSNPDLIGMVMRRAEEMLTTINQFREQVRFALVHPQIEESQRVIEIFKRYMDAYNPNDLFNLVVDTESLISFYKDVLGLTREGVDTVFYEKLAAELKQQVDIRRLNIPTSDDLAIIRDDTLKQTSEKEPKDLKPALERATAVAQWKLFKITPDLLSWNEIGLVRPSDLIVTVSPPQITVGCVYRTNDEETIEVKFTADARTNTLNLRVLEAPEDGYSTRARSINLASAVIHEVEKQARERQKNKPQVALAPPKPEVKKNGNGEYAPRSKIEKGKPMEKGLAQILGAVDQQKEKEKGPMKDFIDIPDEKGYQQLFEEDSITNTDVINRIKKRIKLFNDGVGFLKPLKKIDPNQERHYSLRIGHYRVLFTLKGSERSKREFNVVKIAQRTIVYDDLAA